MELSQSLCAKHPGGVRRIALYEASKILSATYNKSLGAFTSVEVEEGYSPVEVAFEEESASWSESADDKGGVEHCVEFSLRGCRTRALESLMGLSEEGIVAEVECADGERYIVGYSVEAAILYPLRLSLGALDTKNHKADKPTSKVRLLATDGWYSHQLLGE